MKRLDDAQLPRNALRKQKVQQLNILGCLVYVTFIKIADVKGC